MGSPTLLFAAAATFLIALGASGQQDCDSGPPPPSDFGAFVWVNSAFEPNGIKDGKAARERLGVDFLCQDTIDGLPSSFSALVPISEVDFSSSCAIPLEGACDLLSSCPSGSTDGRRRRLMGRCMPYFGCKVIVTVPVAVPQRLAEGEVVVEPPNIEPQFESLRQSTNVVLGICFEGSCSLFGVDDFFEILLGALAYKQCPETYANTRAGDRTALHWAAIMGSNMVSTAELEDVQESIRALVENGADLEARDAAGFTPLHFASKWGVFSTLRGFIDLGADIEAQDNAGNTPLVTASFFGRDVIVEDLLAAGANPNARYFDDSGDASLASKTPLHFASLYSGKIFVVQKLIEAGADVNAVDDAGDTPLGIAERHGRLKIIDILKANGAI